MHNRSISRELSLLSLGLIKDNGDLVFNKYQIEEIYESALDSLINHCREELDICEENLENASQNLLESELCDVDNSFFEKIRDEIKKSFSSVESVMNTLSHMLDFPKLIVSSQQLELKDDVILRISKVLDNIIIIDNEIDHSMEGWKFKRLPRIDRDILRLAYVDINFLNTPVAVACNEAVNLANKYSDTQGRKMINGVLRRLQKLKLTN